jgi:hypothetical protein
VLAGVADAFRARALAAGQLRRSAGMMKKITYDTTVIVKNRTIAQRIRRTRY